MARDNLSACLSITLVHEGGYSVHRSDRGNWTSGKVGVGELKGTNMGIAAHSYPHLDIKNLKQSDVIPIYRKNYWNPINGEMLPYGVDLATLDAGIMSGPSRGAKWLQKAAGVKQDGRIGPETLRSVAADDGDVIVKRLCGYRLSFVQGLGTFKVFGKGWSRRIADIEAKGVAMWLRYGAGKSAGQVADRMAAEAKGAAEDAGKAGRGAATGGIGGATAGGGEYLTGSGLLLVLGLVMLLVAVGLVIRSRQHSARAEAYGRELEVQELDEMAGQ